MENRADNDASNISLSLDDYIKKNPNALRDITVKKRITPPSQQWRLGRNGPNGPRGLKRLYRHGPLRPFTRYSNRGPNAPHRADDGLPRLVLKRYGTLPASSVFHRLGWHPPHIALARQKLYQARTYHLRRRFNNQLRGRQAWPPNQGGWNYGMPRYGPRSNWRPMWRGRQWPRGHWQRGGGLQRPAFNLARPQSDAQQLIRAQRMQNQQSQPRNQAMWQQRQMSNQYVAQRQGSTNQYVAQRQGSSQFSDQMVTNNFPQPSVFYPPDQRPMEEQPVLPSTSAGQYRIERDNYIPPANVRPPSPVESIISTFSRNRNPFARADQPPPLTNPFGVRSTSSSGCRVMPTTTNITCTQRFGLRNNPYQTSMVVD